MACSSGGAWVSERCRGLCGRKNLRKTVIEAGKLSRDKDCEVTADPEARILTTSCFLPGGVVSKLLHVPSQGAVKASLSALGASHTDSRDEVHAITGRVRGRMMGPGMALNWMAEGLLGHAAVAVLKSPWPGHPAAEITHGQQEVLYQEGSEDTNNTSTSKPLPAQDDNHDVAAGPYSLAYRKGLLSTPSPLYTHSVRR
jgi:hypothetical protein